MTQNLENYRKILKKYHRQVPDEVLLEIVQNIQILAQCFRSFEQKSKKQPIINNKIDLSFTNNSNLVSEKSV